MERLQNICVIGARIYRTLNRPLLRSSVSVEHAFFKNESAEKPLATVRNTVDAPKIGLLDLLIVLCAVKTILSVAGLFRK